MNRRHEGEAGTSTRVAQLQVRRIEQEALEARSRRADRTLSRNQRHDQLSEIHPPSVGPKMGAIMTPMPQAARHAALRSGKISHMIACDSGMSGRRRGLQHARSSSTVMFGASPHSTEAP